MGTDRSGRSSMLASVSRATGSSRSRPGGVGRARTRGGNRGSCVRRVTPTPTPKLPGEYFRKPSQLTAAGTLFDNICVRINGDVARHPRSSDGQAASAARPCRSCGSITAREATTTRSTGASSSCRRLSSTMAGWRSVRPRAGTLYSHPTAAALQVAGYDYMRRPSRSRATCSVRPRAAAHSRSRPTRASSSLDSAACTTSTRAYDIRAHYDAGGDPEARCRGLR